MDLSKLVKLIQPVYKEDSLGQQVPSGEVISREVYGTVTSVTRDEWFEAGRSDMNARFRVMVFNNEYHGEPMVELDGKRYAIYRIFGPKSEKLELYLEEKAGI